MRISNITFINAVLYVLENGCKRRALPERFGNLSAVYARCCGWSRNGVLKRLFAALREQKAVGARNAISQSKYRSFCVFVTSQLSRRVGSPFWAALVFSAGAATGWMHSFGRVRE